MAVNGERRVSEHKFPARARFVRNEVATLISAGRTRGQLQQRARSTKKVRPRLAAPAAILTHFHPLLCLAEASCFNRLIPSGSIGPDHPAHRLKFKNEQLQHGEVSYRM